MNKAFSIIVFCFLFMVPAHAQTMDQKAAIEVGKNIRPLQAEDDITARAKEVAEQFRSKDMTDLIRRMSGRVRNTLGVRENEADNRVELAHRNSTWAILFASSSIPIHTLRRYAAQLDKIGGVMVFRGAPGGLSTLGPMVKLTTDIIKHDPDCMRENCKVWNVGVLIDPLLFRSNHISKVPAVMIMDDDPFKAYCEQSDTADSDLSGTAITYGDAHISGHLEALSRLGDRRADTLLKQFFKQEETP